MPVPAGYKQTEWGHVKNGDQIHTYDDKGNNGQGKMYGPYKVVDRDRCMVEEINSYNSLPFEIKTHEAIYVPDNGTLVGGGAFTQAMTSTSSLQQASAAVEAMYEYITFKIASKSVNLDPAHRTKIETEVLDRRETAVRLLADIINRT